MINCIKRRNIATIFPRRFLLVFNMVASQRLYDYDTVYKYQKALNSYLYKNRTGLLQDKYKIYCRNRAILFDALIICEHQSTYTLGRGSNVMNILHFDENEEESGSIDIVKLYEKNRESKNFRTSNNSQIRRVERGGEVTWHGPGQITIYPIMDLKKPTFCVPNINGMKYEDIRWYICAIEECVIRLLKILHIPSDRNEINPGVWIENKGVYDKIAAIGISASRWITLHGCSINVDLSMKDIEYYYAPINPCGIIDPLYRNVTSVLNYLAMMENGDMIVNERDIYKNNVINLFVEQFVDIFGYKRGSGVIHSDDNCNEDDARWDVSACVLDDTEICNEISYQTEHCDAAHGSAVDLLNHISNVIKEIEGVS